MNLKGSAFNKGHCRAVACERLVLLRGYGEVDCVSFQKYLEQCFTVNRIQTNSDKSASSVSGNSIAGGVSVT